MNASEIIILTVIIAAIAAGSLLKVNYGLLGMTGAFFCGVCLLGMSSSDVMDSWGIKLFFQLFSITFFYAFAVNNGTLKLIAAKTVYSMRGAAFLMPAVLFLISALIAGIGPGTIATFLIMAPVVMQVAKESGMKPELAAIALCCGANAGAWDPIASNGITVRGIIESCGYDPERASLYGNRLFICMVLTCTLFFAVSYFVFKGWECRTMDKAGAPVAFSPGQKRTLLLIALFAMLVIIPTVLKGIIKNDLMSFITKLTDSTFSAIFFGVLAVLLKTGDEKKTISGVAWGTILNVCGMGMLISVAVKAGVMDRLSAFINGSFPEAALPYVMGITAAVMSLFSSTMGVVVPTLYPVVSSLAQASGSDAALMFAVIPICAISAGNSPLSLFGGLVQASLENEEERRKMFLRLILIAAAMISFSLALTFVLLRFIA